MTGKDLVKILTVAMAAIISASWLIICISKSAPIYELKYAVYNFFPHWAWVITPEPFPEQVDQSVVNFIMHLIYVIIIPALIWVTSVVYIGQIFVFYLTKVLNAITEWVRSIFTLSFLPQQQLEASEVAPVIVQVGTIGESYGPTHMGQGDINVNQATEQSN